MNYVRVEDRYLKFKKACKYLQTLYHEEFIQQLIAQSVNVKDRYKAEKKYSSRGRHHFPIRSYVKTV